MLKIEPCPDLGGYCVTSTSLVESVKQVVEHCKIHKPSRGKTGSWEGRSFENWDEIGEAFLKPWAEGLKKVQDMLEEIRGHHIEAPESMRRRSEWNELEGDVDVDRALNHSPDFLRRVRRRNVSAPRHVAVICNVGNTGGYTAEQIFWRGAAAIAAIDLLESADYQCEVHCFNHAFGAYGGSCFPPIRSAVRIKSTSQPQGLHNFFYTARLKDCGEPLDVDRLTNGLSAWFFRSVIFGMRDVVKRGGFGAGGSHNVVGRWVEKMDISEGITKVFVPSVFDKEGAIEVAKQILEDVKNPPTEQKELN